MDDMCCNPSYRVFFIWFDMLGQVFCIRLTTPLWYNQLSFSLYRVYVIANYQFITVITILIAASTALNSPAHSSHFRSSVVSHFRCTVFYCCFSPIYYYLLLFESRYDPGVLFYWRFMNSCHTIFTKRILICFAWSLYQRWPIDIGLVCLLYIWNTVCLKVKHECGEAVSVGMTSPNTWSWVWPWTAYTKWFIYCILTLMTLAVVAP